MTATPYLFNILSACSLGIFLRFLEMNAAFMKNVSYWICYYLGFILSKSIVFISNPKSDEDYVSFLLRFVSGDFILLALLFDKICT